MKLVDNSVVRSSQLDAKEWTPLPPSMARRLLLYALLVCPQSFADHQNHQEST